MKRRRQMWTLYSDRRGALEAACSVVVAGTDDMKEGTAAFLEKRTPVFRGR